MLGWYLRQVVRLGQRVSELLVREHLWAHTMCLRPQVPAKRFLDRSIWPRQREIGSTCEMYVLHCRTSRATRITCKSRSGPPACEKAWGDLRRSDGASDPPRRNAAA